ncbi:MAG: DUF1801 domain-containing protein [Pseudomonadota bacterium]
MSKANKTQPSDAAVSDYFDAIDDPQRRADCRELDAIMQRVTRREPVLWGTSIIGYGSYHYVYDSGREGDMCLTGFASRGKDIAVYIMDGFDAYGELLQQLGPHRKGKSCLYLKRLDGVDTKVLARLLRTSVATMRKRYRCQ